MSYLQMLRAGRPPLPHPEPGKPLAHPWLGQVVDSPRGPRAAWSGPTATGPLYGPGKSNSGGSWTLPRCGWSRTPGRSPMPIRIFNLIIGIKAKPAQDGAVIP